MHGFKDYEAASRFCREHGELGDRLRPRRRYYLSVSASLRRPRFAKATRIALGIMTDA